METVSFYKTKKTRRIVVGNKKKFVREREKVGSLVAFKEQVNVGIDTDKVLQSFLRGAQASRSFSNFLVKSGVYREFLPDKDLNYSSPYKKKLPSRY